MVHAAWADFRDMTYRVYYKRSFDHGLTWIADAPLSSSTGVNPSISVSGMDVHAVWTSVECEIMHRGSTDGGETWSDERQLSSSTNMAGWASVFSSGPMVHAAWHDGHYAQVSEVTYRRSRDHGSNWGPEERLTEADGFSTIPELAADGDMVHLVFWDSHDTWPEVYYKRDPVGNVPGVAEGRRWQPGAATSLLRPNPISSFARIPGWESRAFVGFDAAGRPVQQCTGDGVGAGLAAGVYLLRSADGSLGPIRFVKLQ